jgi:hypothetical protein
MQDKAMKALVDIGVFSPKQANWFNFGCIRVAEEEIAAAIKKHPKKHREAIDGTFKHACCTEMLRAKGSYTLYRAHVRELIERMIAGVDVHPGTKAEVLAMMSGLSFIAPLTREFYAVYVRLFSGIYPQHMAAIGNPDWKREEPWPGRTDELIGELQRKLIDSRGIEPTKKKPKKGASLEVHSQERSRVPSHPQNGHEPRDSGLPRGRGSRPQNGRNQRPVRRAQGNRREPARRRPLD